MKPHIDSSIADAEDNGYYTYIIQCQMTPEKLSDVLEPNWTGGLRDMVARSEMAKFVPFLSLDCTSVEGVGVQSKERKGSNFAA